MNSGTELAEIREEILQAVSRVCCSFGLNESVAHIWSYLLFANEPRSLEEIAEGNGLALSTTSSNLKLLEAIGDVERIRKPGDKRVYYGVTESLDKRMESFIRNILENEVVPIMAVMEKAEHKLNGMGDDPETRVFKTRVKNMKESMKQMERRISMMLRFAKMKRSFEGFISKREK